MTEHKGKPETKMYKAQIIPLKWGKNKGRFGWVVTTPDVLYRSNQTFRTRELCIGDAVGVHGLTIA